MMEEFVEYQRLGGIEWTLKLDGKWVDVRLQIPLFFVIGDTEGHDKLVGRKVARPGQNMSNNQCRCCDIDHDGCGDPLKPVTLTKAAEITKLRNEKDVRRLDDLSYKLIECAFDDVEFGDNVRGIHGGTPAEVLHAVNAGLQDTVIGCTYEQKRDQWIGTGITEPLRKKTSVSFTWQ